MKKLLLAALVFVPFVALVVGVNFYADPANVLRPGYEAQVAQILADGQNASNIRNMDDRALIQEYMERSDGAIDTLILGSSHSMQITSGITGDAATFCAGVTGADLRNTREIKASVTVTVVPPFEIFPDNLVCRQIDQVPIIYFIGIRQIEVVDSLPKRFITFRELTDPNQESQ